MYHYLAKLPLYHNKTMPSPLSPYPPHSYNNLPQFLSTNPTANYPDSFITCLRQQQCIVRPLLPTKLLRMRNLLQQQQCTVRIYIHIPLYLIKTLDTFFSTQEPNSTQTDKSPRYNSFSYEHVLYQIIIAYTQNPFGDKYSHQPTAILFPISHNAICLRIRNNCTAECYEQYYTSLHNPCIYN